MRGVKGDFWKMRSRDGILILICVVLFAALAFAAPFGRWGWSLIPYDFRLPMLGFLANLILVAITIVYVLITREQLRELQSTRDLRCT
jgi:hypothetical protein